MPYTAPTDETNWMETGVNVVPGEDHQESMLRTLCRTLLVHELRTPAYQTSPMSQQDVDGHQQRASLIEALTDILVVEFTTRFEQEGLAPTDLAVAKALDRRVRRHGSRFYTAIASRAFELALTWLWADLDTEDSPGHQQSIEELRYHANEHLRQSPNRSSVLARYRKISRDEHDLEQRFWQKRIWPGIFEGKTRLRSPLHLHVYLRDVARYFLLDEHKELDKNEDLTHWGDVRWREGQEDKFLHVADPDEGMPHMSSGRSGASSIESMVLGPGERDDPIPRLFREMPEIGQRDRRGILIGLARTYPEALLRHVLQSVTRTANGKGLELLCFLLEAFPGEAADREGAAKMQSIVSLMETWRTDSGSLKRYLWALDISDEQVGDITDLALKALNAHREPLIEKSMTERKSRFLSALWWDLVTMKPDPSPTKALDDRGGQPVSTRTAESAESEASEASE